MDNSMEKLCRFYNNTEEDYLMLIVYIRNLN